MPTATTTSVAVGDASLALPMFTRLDKLLCSEFDDASDNVRMMQVIMYALEGRRDTESRLINTGAIRMMPVASPYTLTPPLQHKKN